MNYLKNVTTLKLDTEKCTGCGLCRTVCPHGVFRIINGKAEITDKDLCMECGACARNCAFGALEVRAGVGCAAGIIWGALNNTEPSCGDGNGSSCCGSGSVSTCCGSSTAKQEDSCCEDLNDSNSGSSGCC